MMSPPNGNYAVVYFHNDDLTFEFRKEMFLHCLKGLAYLEFLSNLLVKFYYLDNY